MEIKFCGTASLFDVNIAKAVGATEVGVICHPEGGTYTSTSAPEEFSHTVPESYGAWLMRQAARSQLTTVLVARSKAYQDISGMVDRLRPDRLQLSEVEDPGVVAALYRKEYRPVIAKVMHVNDGTKPEELDVYLPYIDVAHLDSDGERPGGNGTTHDLEISRELASRARAAGKLVALSGGLDKDNVAKAIKVVQPDIVDVETFIKGKFGRHSNKAGREFVEAARKPDDTVEDR